jgi:hypothetical protein
LFLAYNHLIFSEKGESHMRFMFQNKPLALVLSVLLVAALAGCNILAVNPPTPTNQPSVTPQLPQDTSTPQPPTNTPEPSATLTPVASEIVFTPGTTAGVVTGTLQAGQVQSYTLAASQNQPLILILDSTYGDYYLGVTSPDSSTLLDPANHWNRLQWVLPQTGTYTIQVIASTRSESFTLTAKVAKLVNFASGLNTITLNGSTINGFVVSYAFYCTAGQTMDAALNVPSTTAYLDIFGIAGGLLLDPSVKANTWSGALTSTQYYIVEVIPNNGQVVSYSLTVGCH